jgi:hypothetical protein
MRNLRATPKDDLSTWKMESSSVVGSSRLTTSHVKDIVAVVVNTIIPQQWHAFIHYTYWLVWQVQRPVNP